MAGRRALLPTRDLRRMAQVAREECVTFRRKIDPLGNFSFSLSPLTNDPSDKGDDLDDRIAEFGAR